MGEVENQSDARLLELCMAGDENAFLQLYNRLKAPIFRYAFYITGSQASAEEVVQEVFISLLKNGNRYKSAQGDLPGFVFGIARNLIRRLRKHERLKAEFPDNEALERRCVNRPEAEDLSTRMIRDESIERIRMAVASLPDHYRDVIVLCDLCEITYTEAAARLRCAVGTIRSRLNRGHALLAQKLRETKTTKPELRASGTEECLI